MNTLADHHEAVDPFSPAAIVPHRKPLTMPANRISFRNRFDGCSIEIRAISPGDWIAELTIPGQHFSATAEDPVAAVVRLSYQLRELPM